MVGSVIRKRTTPNSPTHFPHILRRFSRRLTQAGQLLLLPAALLLSACNGNWNNPHPEAESGQNIIYSAFSERPKHLDPARSYGNEESRFIDQIYDAPLAYHYLKRPYELIPNTLTHLPDIRYSDVQGNEVPEDSADVAFSTYYFELKPGIRYQPHPAFAKNDQGQFVYRFNKSSDAGPYRTLADFKQTGSRELVAADYLYQIKRLADPALLSPVRGLLSEFIVGMSEFSDQVTEQRKSLGKGDWLDLRPMTFSGIQQSDDYHFSIRLKGKYPQFSYWLAFHFFAPMPWEADAFYHQPGMAQRNIVLDWYPVGTGPFMMTRNDPNEVIVLERNPNYRDDFYPAEGEAGDAEKGLLADAGKRLPLLDKAVYRLEKESIPFWTKFLQGYYDRSGITSDSFDQAVKIGHGGVGLSDEMREKGVTLGKEIVLGTYYLGFNMMDPVLGDTGTAAEREKKRKLRQAIAIAYDEEESLNIFSNGRGEVGMGPIPPGIFGFQSGEEGLNHSVFNWADGKPQRKPLEEARRLLAEAGYPDGRDEKSGEPLVLNLDTVTAGAGGSAGQNWMIKQFRKLNIQLNIRGTDYNRFKEKMNTGNAQMFQWGWLADYPDAENFLFLLYGPNGQVVSGGTGVNASNYNNEEYNRLFERTKLMDNTPQRMTMIREMVHIVQHDLPWASIWHPYSYVLSNQWVRNVKAHGISKSVLKYYAVDPQLRAAAQAKWNRPVLWPLGMVAVIVGLLAIPGVVAFRRRQQRRVHPANRA